MQRRDFIRNTGLTVAGLTLSSGIQSRNNTQLKSLEIIILLSGGVCYNDIIDVENKQSILFFQEKAAMHIDCLTNVKFSAQTLEHSNAVLHILNSIADTSSKKIIISDKNSASTIALSKAQLPFEIIATTGLNSSHPYRNDAAIFEKAATYISNKENVTLILNLDDSDIAHYNIDKYKEVLTYYNAQINLLCKQIYDSKFTTECVATLMVASALGRNNISALLNDTCNEAINHYDESATELFCFNTRSAKNYTISYNHQAYKSHEILNMAQHMLV